MTKTSNIPEHLLDLGSNLGEVDAPVTPAKAARNKVAKAAQPAAEGRTWIVLEDNDQIPPGGQFIGVDGRSYLLKAGEKAYVPDSILHVLDCAVMSVPITDDLLSVIGYRDRLRFPYRVVTAQREG